MDEATRKLLDDLDPGGEDKQKRSTWQTYRAMSAGERILWRHQLEQFGPRHDFRYHNDDPLTEEIRARYNELVTDPSLRSKPEEIALEDLPGYEYDWDGWNDRF